jgi:dTMP kinase
MRGRFITFEGVDGVGKTVQCTMLADRLKQEGYNVLATKEPGSPVEPTKLGLELRQILFHTVTTHNMAPGVADLLFLADHVQHVAKVIEPALAEEKLVICDRYSDSQFAYAKAKKCPGYILEAYRAAFGPIPDVTVLFVSTDPAITLARAQARRGVEAGKQEGKVWNEVQEQKNIQQEYLSDLVGKSRTLVITVSPEQTPGQIFEILWSSLQTILSQPVEYIVGEKTDVIEIPFAHGAGQI